MSSVLRGLWQEACREFEANLEDTVKSQWRKMGSQDSIMVYYVVIFFHSGKERHLETLLATEIKTFPYSTVSFLVNDDELSKTVVSKGWRQKEISFAIFNQAICANNLFPVFKVRRKENDHTWGPTRKPESGFPLQPNFKAVVWTEAAPHPQAVVWTEAVPALRTLQDCLTVSPADRNRLCLEARLVGGACRRTARLEKTEQRKGKLKTPTGKTRRRREYSWTSCLQTGPILFLFHSLSPYWKLSPSFSTCRI